MQRLLLALARFAVGLYYRTRRVGSPVPAEGPLLLVANHPNGLVDPVLLASTTRRPLRFLAKEPLFRMPVLGAVLRGMRALPVYRAQDGADTARNAGTFGAVHEALAAGEVVCLFPEGRSHDEPGLQELKTGAARMALGAEASATGSLGVRVVPVGLVYRAKRRFRSHACACVGAPIAVADLRAEHARNEREAVRVLTDRIAEGLARVTLELERWEELPLLEVAGQLIDPAGGAAPARLQELSHGLHRLRAEGDDEDRRSLEELTCRVTAFRDRLRRLGVAPNRLHARYRAGAVAAFALRSTLHLSLSLPLALLGVLLWYVPYRAVPLLADRAAGGTSPDAHRDLLATARILAGSVLFPLWWLGLTFAAHVLAGPAAALLALPAAPASGLLALRFGDWQRETRADVRAFGLLASRRGLRERLVTERAELAAEITRLGGRLRAGGAERGVR